MMVLVGATARLLQASDWVHQAIFRGFSLRTDRVIINWNRSAIEYQWVADSLAHASRARDNRLLESLMFNGQSGVMARNGPLWASVGTPTLAEETSPLLSEDHAFPCCEGASASLSVGLKTSKIAHVTDARWFGPLAQPHQSFKND